MGIHDRIRFSLGDEAMLVPWHAIERGLERSRALALVKAAFEDPASATYLRELLEQHSTIAGLDDAAIVERLADLLASGGMVLVRLPMRSATWFAPQLVRGDEHDRPSSVPMLSDLAPRAVEPAPSRSKSWIEIVLVGESGLSTEGTEIRVRLGGSEHRPRCDANGRVRVDDLATDGTCDVMVVGPVALHPSTATPADGDQSVDSVRGGAFDLATNRVHRIVALRPTATIVELDDASFDTAGVVLRPAGQASDASDDAPVRGLLGLGAAMSFVQRHPGAMLWAAGHADTVGASTDNVTLSHERARNVHLLLAGDRTGWAQHCDAHYTVGDFQAAYAWVAAVFGWDCDPGPVDGDFGPRSRGARDRFRERYNDELGGSLERGTKQSVSDWEAIFDLYDRGLVEAAGIAQDEFDDVRRTMLWLNPPAIGLGEAYPRVAADKDGFASAANRRVDIVCVAAGADVYLGQPPEPSGLYGTDSERVFRRNKLYVRGADPTLQLDRFMVQLFDDEGNPVPNERYELWLPDGRFVEGTLDAKGFARVDGVPAGTCRLVLLDIDAREWGATAVRPRPVSPSVQAVAESDAEPDPNDVVDDSMLAGDTEHDDDDTGDEFDDEQPAEST